MTRPKDTDGFTGAIGYQHDTSKCEHGPDDACEWCCSTCNYDRHICPQCGTVIGHNDIDCGGHAVD